MRDGERTRLVAAGFTLLELMIVVTILGIIASVGVPQYVSALRAARVNKAGHELAAISRAIDSYAATHGGNLPLTLHLVGFGGKRDPWGVPYCYLNYADGTGDGLAWAIAAGIVDPSSFKSTSGSGGTPLFGFVPAVANRRGEWALAAHRPQGGDDTVGGSSPRVAAMAQARTVATQVTRELTSGEIDSLADAIVTNGSLAFFAGVASGTTQRRDRYMFPLNTDYDLFSLGPDTRTAVSLGETVGLDDVIRANNGGYFGRASEY